MVKKEKFPLVYLQWCDAISNHGEWMDVPGSLNWANDDDWIIRQTGFIINETKEYILLASKLNAHPNHLDIPMVSGLQKIPKTWIRKRVDFNNI